MVGVHKGFWKVLNTPFRSPPPSSTQLSQSQQQPQPQSQLQTQTQQTNEEGKSEPDTLVTHVMQIINELQQKKQRPLYITGHSLGGALALSVAGYLVREAATDMVGGIFTYGQPRVGDGRMIKLLHDVYGDR